jgi:hypothetical protein
VDLARLVELFRALEREGVEYVLVGGVAVNFHGLSRATQDVDLFVRPTRENVERLKAALQAVFADGCIDEISADDLMGDYPTIRYVPPNDPFVVDLLGRLGVAVRYEDLAFQAHLVDGVRVRLATPATLYRMKKDTIRPIDRADAQALRQRFNLRED